MKKWILFMILAMAVLAGTAVFPGQALATDVYLNGELLTFDQPPVVVSNRVLVPMRGIFNAFGADVAWDDDTQSVGAWYGSTDVLLYINSTTAYINSQPVTLDVPAQLVGGRTMVPLRFVAEALGCEVQYVGADDAVYITDTGAPPSDSNTYQGEYNWDNGDRYKGEMANGLPNGYGVWDFWTPVYDDYWVEYEGEWIDGNMSGSGTLYLGSDGTYFEGYFDYNEITNYGTYHAPGSDSSSGYWHTEMRNGNLWAVCDNGTEFEYRAPGTDY